MVRNLMVSQKRSKSKLFLLVFKWFLTKWHSYEIRPHCGSRNLLVKVVNAVNLIVKVDSEGNSVETLITDTASKTSGVIVIAHGLKNLQ